MYPSTFILKMYVCMKKICSISHYSETCDERSPHLTTEILYDRVFHWRYKYIEMLGHVTRTGLSTEVSLSQLWSLSTGFTVYNFNHQSIYR